MKILQSFREIQNKIFTFPGTGGQSRTFNYSQNENFSEKIFIPVKFPP